MKRPSPAILILLFGVLLIACPAAAQDKSLQDFSKSLTEFTANAPEEIENTLANDDEDLKGLKKLTILRFSSKKPVQPDTYAKVVLMVFEYETRDLAMTAMRSVVKDAEEEMRKEPEFNFVDGTKFYKLIGPCLLSEDKWNPIETKLTDAVSGKGKKPSAFVRIACGGKMTVDGIK